jgi:hypothetical protein
MSDPAVESAPEPAVTPDEVTAAAPAPGPAPLGVEVDATGYAEVDALLERLADADALPTESHIEVYEDVHRGLRDTLTALDARPGPSYPSRDDRDEHNDRS